MSGFEILPATHEAVRAMRPAKAEYPGRAVMAVGPGGRLLGVGGVDRVGHAMVAWLEISEELRAHPHWIGRHIEAVLGLARGRGLPVLAACDETIRGSARLLRFAGFEPTEHEGVWILPGAEHG